MSTKVVAVGGDGGGGGSEERSEGRASTVEPSKRSSPSRHQSTRQARRGKAVVLLTSHKSTLRATFKTNQISSFKICKAIISKFTTVMGMVKPKDMDGKM